MSLDERLRGVDMNNYNYDDEMQEEQLARKIGELSKAVGFIVFSFIAYLVSYVSRKIYTYFEENAY